MLRLMITADDAGLSTGIDQAVVALHQAGMTSTASLMCNFPQVETAFATYDEHPELELGVHLTLSDGKPLTQAARRSNLVKHNGYFHDRFFLFSLALFPSSKLLAAITEELQAQMDVFIAAGVQPSHITTHHHFHSMPSLRKIVQALAKQYNVQWVRNSNLRLSMIPFNPIFSQNLSKSQLTPAAPDYLTLIQVWLDYPPENLLNAILQLDGWLELVVHPCLPEDRSYPSDVIYSPAERYREVEYLERLFALMQPYLGGEIEIVKGHPQRKLPSHA